MMHGTINIKYCGCISALTPASSSVSSTTTTVLCVLWKCNSCRIRVTHNCFKMLSVFVNTRWFKYDRYCLHLFTSVNSPGHIWTTLYIFNNLDHLVCGRWNFTTTKQSKAQFKNIVYLNCAPVHVIGPSEFITGILHIGLCIIVNDDQQDATILAYLSIPNQLYMFRAITSPIIRSTWLYLHHLILSTVLLLPDVFDDTRQQQ